MLIGMPTSRPSALLDFASGGIDPRLTFSRASAATRTNRTGIIETVASGVPRIDHDPLTGAVRGVLIEPQSTNLVRYSSDLTNSVWEKNGSTAESSAVVAPTGVTFKKIKESAATGVHEVSQAIVMTPGATYAISAVFLAAERTEVRLAGRPFSSWSVFPSATFDLSSGTVTSGSNARIENLGGGVFRCSVIGAASGTSGGMLIGIAKGGLSSYLGDGVSGVYVTGMQMEESSRASSLIETTSAQVTRVADSLSLQSSAFSRVIAAGKGTLYIELMHGRASWPTTPPAALCLSDGAGTGETSGIVVSLSASGTALDVTSGGVSQASLSSSSGSAAGIHRIAIAYKNDRFALSANGLATVSDVSGTAPAITRLDIGSVIGARHFNGWIRRIAVFPRDFDNVILQNMSI